MTKREEKHRELVEALMHTFKHHEYSLILIALQKMPHGVNLLRAVEWVEKYSPYTVVFKGKVPSKFERDGTDFDIEQASANPYWKIEIEDIDNDKNTEFDLTKYNAQKSFKRFIEHPHKQNHTKLLKDICSYMETGKHLDEDKTKKKSPGVYVHILQGGSPGLGKRS